MTPPASGAIPRGWSVDHRTPSDFVVRCTACGRISIRDERATAHRQAQSHALSCSQTGVTPVSRPEGDASVGAGEESEPSLLLEGVNLAAEDVVGMEVVVRYESISSRAGTQRASGLIESRLGGDSAPYRGVELHVDDDRRLRVDVVDEAVLCRGRELNDGEVQWRKIGNAEVLRPTRLENSASSAVATDGGAR